MPLSQNIIDAILRSPDGEAAYHIVEKLTDAGYDTWWVGGCVRDMLSDSVPKEIDIATEAAPDIVKKLFPKYDAKGEIFGSIIVSEKNRRFEVTTFREDDSASDGRHPKSVTFGSLKDDAKRRDITINALYFHPISRELYDPFEGEGDLREKLIRIIGNPVARIEHDALRLLRVIRFRALIDGQYHPDTYHALHENAKLIGALSGVRQLEELTKILMGPRPQRAFEDLWETDILETLIPELSVTKGVAQPSDFHHEGDVWDHTMKLLSAFTEEHGIDIRFAGLFHDCGKAETFKRKERIRFDEHATVGSDLASRILDRLQCPSRQRDKIAWLIKHHMMMGAFTEMPPERKAHWYFHPWFRELLQLFWLDIAGTEPAEYILYNKIVQDYHLFLDQRPRPPRQLLKGDEIMEILGIPAGEEIGKILSALHDAQVRGEVTTKSDAKEYLRKHTS